jgi:hypothetical protein
MTAYLQNNAAIKVGGTKLAQRKSAEKSNAALCPKELRPSGLPKNLKMQTQKMLVGKPVIRNLSKVYSKGRA